MSTPNFFDFNTAKRLDEGEARSRQVNAEDIKARLNADVRGFVQWLYSGRALCSAREARIGDVHGTPGASLSISLSGPDAGLWKDHATGQGGDLISLYMAAMGYGDGKNFQLALKEIAAEHLGDAVEVKRAPWQPSVTARIEEQKQKLGSKPRDDMLELGAPVATWKYRDTHGNVVASVVRYEPDDTPASKTYRPYCFKTVEGRTKWVMGAPSLRPLFRIPEIALASTVVLVEGEKCAEALAAIGVEATTAMQGAEAPIDRTDWSPLSGKSVIVWPDNDEPGFAYGRRVAERLSAIGCRVLLVDIPAGKPAKWDAADCVAEGGDARAIVNAAVPMEAADKPRIRFLDVDELETLRPPEWLVDTIIPTGGLSVLWGRSGALKSFVALDLALCVATGHPWHGKACKLGLVIYVAAEGAHGLGLRVLGWRKTRGKDLPKPRFKLVPHSVALTGEDLQPMIAGILGFGETPALVVIDTLARTFGPGDENKQADMNAYVTAADRLRDATGAHVMIIHHSGVHEDKRERGSNVLRGAADTVIKVSRTEDRLEVVNRAPEGKQKDAEEFATVCLRKQVVAFTQGDQEHTTLVLNLDEDPKPRSEERRAKDETAKLGSNEKKVIEALTESGEALGLTRLVLMTKSDKANVARALRTLAEKGRVERADEVDGPQLWRLV